MSYYTYNNKRLTIGKQYLQGSADDNIIVGPWYLPAYVEIGLMYDLLYSFSIGNFSATTYWSSTEDYIQYPDPDNYAIGKNFNTSDDVYSLKSATRRVRPCRVVYAPRYTYNEGDPGPGGGLIFGNDFDMFPAYVQAYPSDLGNMAWSNITNISCGAMYAELGEGYLNTQLIINQVGHTTSAAKACNDLNL